MKKLLAIRNHKKSTEQGFSIAVSTGFGLVIMIIGLTMMGRAMKDSSVSASQKIITRSDAAAQTGATRYIAFLAKYPHLADAPSNQWTTIIPDNDEVSEYASTADWKNVDAGAGGANGQFKLLSYTPSGTDDKIGTVKIQGRVGQTADGGNDIQTGTAVKVDYNPVEVALVPTGGSTTTGGSAATAGGTAKITGSTTETTDSGTTTTGGTTTTTGGTTTITGGTTTTSNGTTITAGTTLITGGTSTITGGTATTNGSTTTITGGTNTITGGTTTTDGSTETTGSTTTITGGTTTITDGTAQTTDGTTTITGGTIATTGGTIATTGGSSGTESVLFPSIWLTKGPGEIGQYFDAEGLLEDSYADSTTNSLYARIDATKKNKGYKANRTSMRIADFLPSKSTWESREDLNNLGNVTAGLSLPRAEDKYSTETIDGVATNVYRYKVSSVSLGNNDTLLVNTVNADKTSTETTKTPQKVIFYVDGNIAPEGGADIKQACANKKGDSVTDTTGCDLTNFIIYGYKNTAISSQKICTHGRHQLQGFIIAPDYLVGGNASGNGKGAYKGAVWAKEWSSGQTDDCKGNGTSDQLMLARNPLGTWSDLNNLKNASTSLSKMPSNITITSVAQASPATAPKVCIEYKGNGDCKTWQ